MGAYNLNERKVMKEKYTITLTATQAGLVLGALENESNDDAVEFGEYSYWRCWRDVAKKLIKAGFWSDAIAQEFGEGTRDEK